MLCGHGPCFWLGQKTLEEHTDCGIKDNVSSHCWQDGNLGFFVQLTVLFVLNVAAITSSSPLSFKGNKKVLLACFSTFPTP